MKTKAITIATVLFTAFAAITGCQKNPPTPAPTPVPATVKIDSTTGLRMIGVTVTFTVTPNDYQITQSGLAYSTGNDSTQATKVAAKMNTGAITQILNGLSINTKYNTWAYTKTAKGTIYSHKVKILTYGLMDYDGNGYHTVKIAGKTFTVENLKVTHYRNGDAIPNVTDDLAWHNATTGAMCWYNNDRAKYDSVYGALYNWYAVNDTRGLAPKGWHVPSYDEWNKIVIALGNNSLTLGGKFKEAGIKHWKAPKTGATNATGFTALPGGDRGENAAGVSVFMDLKESAIFWDSTTFPIGKSAMATFFQYKDNFIWMSNGFSDYGGFSIRLIRN